MIVAADETGSFRSDRDLGYGIVTLVTITDKAWGDFENFMSNHFGNSWAQLKSKNLDYDQRKVIIRYIGQHNNEIKYTAHLYDLEFGSDDSVLEHQGIQAKKYLKDNVHPKMKKELENLSRQLNNLSIADYSIFTLILELFIEWQSFFQFDYVSINTTRDSWTLNTVVDTQNRSNRFLTLLRDSMVLTTNELNPSYSVFSPKEWDKKHPYNIRHSVDGDLTKQSGRKFFEHLKIGNELNDPSLFLPDLIGNTILRSIKHQDEIKWLKVLKKLKANRSLTMTNRFIKSKQNYYLVRGFDKSKDRGDVSILIQKHYQLMKSL